MSIPSQNLQSTLPGCLFVVKTEY